MPNTLDFASAAALMGDPTRARMLAALMDGRARTATELALEGGVTASTTSSHLGRLTAAGMLAIVRQGRHRYFRIATPEVAAALEGMMSIAPPRTGSAPRPGPREEGMRYARVCYDHLAGVAGVALLDEMRRTGVLSGSDEELALTGEGERWCATVGVDLSRARSTRRRLCRACLDWSERRTHLAGALGAAVLERMFALGYARRERGSRTVVLNPRGETFVRHLRV
jgi:DNA-binding transcriptional ArsR family regulator